MTTLRSDLHEFAIDCFTLANSRSKGRPAKRLALEALEEAAHAIIDTFCDRVFLALANDPETQLLNGDDMAAKQKPVGHLGPVEAITAIVSWFRGTGDKMAALHAAADLLRLALDQISPDPQPVFGSTPELSGLSDAELANKIEEVGQQMGGTTATTAGAFPWQVLLGIAVEVLKRWWDSRNN